MTIKAIDCYKHLSNRTCIGNDVWVIDTEIKSFYQVCDICDGKQHIIFRDRTFVCPLCNGQGSVPKENKIGVVREGRIANVIINIYFKGVEDCLVMVSLSETWDIVLFEYQNYKKRTMLIYCEDDIHMKELHKYIFMSREEAEMSLKYREKNEQV